MNKTRSEDLLHRLRRINRPGLVAIACAAFILWQVIVVAGSASPILCRTCHEIKISAISLGKSPHAGINCLFCHQDQTALSLLSLQVRSMSNSLTNLVYPKKPIKNAEVTDNVCIACHRKALKETVENNGIKVSHKEFIKDRICIDCHGAVAHELRERVRAYANMEDCMKCHNGIEASDDCGYCHRKDLALNRSNTYKPISVIHGKNWKQNHGLGDSRTCMQCHQDGFCRECHKAEIPHPQPWAALHSSTKASTEECYKCHKKEYCTDCHVMEIPHPETFLPEHIQVVEKEGMDLCWNCHTKESCETCHRFAVHPNIPRF